MIRRLKSEVLTELPSKTRQAVRLGIMDKDRKQLLSQSHLGLAHSSELKRSQIRSAIRQAVEGHGADNRQVFGKKHASRPARGIGGGHMLAGSGLPSTSPPLNADASTLAHFSTTGLAKLGAVTGYQALYGSEWR